jgi:hypothetical protein
MWPDFAGAETRKVAGLRRVGDNSTLVIPLDTNSVLMPSTPDFVIEYAQFGVFKKEYFRNGLQHGLNGAGRGMLGQTQFQQFAVEDAPSSFPFLEIRVQELASPAVRYAYTTASKEWRKYAERRLQRWAWVELYKLEPAKRPFQSPNDFPLASSISIPQAFEVSWDYADDQIPEWYREWEETRVNENSRAAAI